MLGKVAPPFDDRERPKTVSEVGCPIGVMHYYFEHINMCAEYAAWTTEVLKGNRDESNKAPEKLFDWNDDSMAALEGSTGRGRRVFHRFVLWVSALHGFLA